jgi:hypothetical protein
MYQFQKIHASGFELYEATPPTTVKHRKQFVERGVTPATQGSLNLYVRGAFLFEIPAIGFSQVLNAGDTSLNLAIDEFPVGAQCIERALVEGSVRLCLSARKGVRWSRAVVAIEPGHEMTLGAEEIGIVVSGVVRQGVRQLEAGHVFRFGEGGGLASDAGARLATARFL